MVAEDLQCVLDGILAKANRSSVVMNTEKVVYADGGVRLYLTRKPSDEEWSAISASIPFGCALETKMQIVTDGVRSQRKLCTWINYPKEAIAHAPRVVNPLFLKVAIFLAAAWFILFVLYLPPFRA